MRDSREARTARHWKYAFEPDYKENEADGRHLKTGLSEKQKDWIKTAWIIVIGSWHCIFPVWDGDKMRECGAKDHVEAHHVYPQGASRRLNEDPDRPRNIAPLCDKHHRKGQRNQPLERETQDVVHLDSAWANREYPNDHESYQKVAIQRSQQLDEGKEYWVPFWDNWLRKRSDNTITIYTSDPENPPYPDNKNQREHHTKIWDFQKKEWVDS